MSLGITTEELFREIERLNRNTPEGFTVREMSENTRRPAKWCREKLRDLIAAGKAECVGISKREDIAGRPNPTPVYRLIHGEGD